VSIENFKSDDEYEHESLMTKSLNSGLWPLNPRSPNRAIPPKDGNFLMSMSVDRGTLQVLISFNYKKNNNNLLFD
jgi:hypothetical protein